MMRVAWFSPLSITPRGASSTGAYWTDLLLPILRERFEIEVFYDGFESYKEFRTAHFLAAAKRHQERPFDCFIYHFEDKRCADFVRMHLGLIPGIVLFHDILLTTDGPEPILNSSWEETVKLFQNELSTPWPDRAAEYKRERPLAVREIGLAPVAIFSCPRMHAEYRRAIASRPHLGDGRSFYLAHPVEIPVSILEPVKPYRVAMCGTPWIEHRSHNILQALAQLPGIAIDWLVSDQEESAARELLREFKVENATVNLGRTPQLWRQTVEKAVVAIHLHYSVYGQLGPYLNISQAAAVPTIVLDFGSAEYLNPAASFSVIPGSGEVQEIQEILNVILAHTNPRTLGTLGHEIAVEENSKVKVAAELSAVLTVEGPALSKFQRRWAQMQQQAIAVSVRDALPARDQLVAPLAEREEEIFSELGWKA